jgi:hypothetical protein
MREREARQVQTCYVAGAAKSIKEAWNSLRREFSHLPSAIRKLHCRLMTLISVPLIDPRHCNEKRLCNRSITADVGLSMVELPMGCQERIYRWLLPFAHETSPAESFRLRKV